jgi:hypothetical protein
VPYISAKATPPRTREDTEGASQLDNIAGDGQDEKRCALVPGLLRDKQRKRSMHETPDFACR